MKYDYLDDGCQVQGWRTWKAVATEARRRELKLRKYSRGGTMGPTTTQMCYNIGSAALYKLAEAVAANWNREMCPELREFAASIEFQKLVREVMLAKEEEQNENA